MGRTAASYTLSYLRWLGWQPNRYLPTAARYVGHSSVAREVNITNDLCQPNSTKSCSYGEYLDHIEEQARSNGARPLPLQHAALTRVSCLEKTTSSVSKERELQYVERERERGRERKRERERERVRVKEIKACLMFPMSPPVS